MGTSQSKPKSQLQRETVAEQTFSSSTNYTKEIAAYQQAVYHNNQPSTQILKQVNFDGMASDKRNIQSKYANSIIVLNRFWTLNVNLLSDESYASLALQFYMNVFEAIPEASHLFISFSKDTSHRSKIFLGMFGWLVCAISKQDSYHLTHKLSILGKLHESMGVIKSYYSKMRQAFHQTMTDKFGKYYTLRIRFCFDTLYDMVVDVMTGHDFNSKCIQHSDKLSAFIHLIDINELEECLSNDDALEFLHLFMKQQFCSELTLFYKDYKIYKNIADQHHRNTKGEEMNRLYVQETSEREINISCERKDEFYHELKQNEEEYDENVFDAIAKDVQRLIDMNIYPQFVAQVSEIYHENDAIDSDNAKKVISKDNYKDNWNFLLNRLNQSVPVMEIH